MRWLVAACMLAVAFPASAAAQAVTFQAGPTHDGNAAGAGLDRPLRKAWTARVDGVPSYAVIAEGMVFVTVAMRDFSSPPRTVLLALSARDGHRVWQVELGHVWSASAAYAAGRVFVSVDDAVDPGGLSAYSAATGQRLWRTPIQRAGRGRRGGLRATGEHLDRRAPAERRRRALAALALQRH
jgi:outer membrane protein assembly factor BamB